MSPSSVRDPSLIRRENELPGTRDWLVTRTRVDPATKYRSPGIEGYASRASLRAGETISFHVSTNPAAPFRIDLYRMGWYGGNGARHLQSLGPLPGRAQPDPAVGPRRLRECRWEPCASLEIPGDWPSGVYLGKLTEESQGLQSYLIFVVRDERPVDFIVQCSDLTWQAYNRWPDRYSLYDDGHKFWYWGPDVDVGFDRPYGKYCQLVDQPLSIGSGEWFLWEFPLAFWMESQGYDVSYVSGIDTHRDFRAHLRARGLLSVGHDEYVTREIFEGLKTSVAEGLNIAFLSGNTCYGLVDLKPGCDGTPHRVFTRTDRFGTAPPEELEAFPETARFPWRMPSEGTLVGAAGAPPVVGGGDWICRKPGHWLFEGSGMKDADAIPGLVGWEFQSDPAPIPGLEVIASGPTKGGRRDGTYAATIYPGPRGNFVFNASSCWWTDGLSEPPGYVRSREFVARRGPDPRVQRITANLLARMRR